MVKKWIKAILTKPFTILKSMYYRGKGINESLVKKRLAICKSCNDKINTSFGEVCSQCGCILENKTRLENEHCDLCKW